MNALDWAHAKISFDESSPITGKFDSKKYRFLEKPLLSLSDIRIRRTVTYKASSALGTVFLQIALAYRLDQCAGNCYLIGSSQADANVWSKTRGKKWITRIPSLNDSLSSDKYAVTQSLFMWPHKWLEIQGPGENAQQGRQCAFLFTDESHVDEYAEGALAAFEERTGKKWNAHHLHNTTAATEGKEVDRYYYQGGQNEFHFRCTKCNSLVWPLWEEDAKAQYNGERVFVFKESDDSPIFVCPFCSSVYLDDSRQRYALHENADYVTKNEEHGVENESFRWNCFGAWFMPWSGHLAKYREAIEAAKIGNLEPHENWIKKRLCQSYKPVLPDFGESKGNNNYSLGDVWGVPNTTRMLTVDYQAGKKSEGSHLLALCTEWDMEGNSRRVDYRRLDTWAQLRAMQIELNVTSQNVYVDCGYDDRTVFWQCSIYKWYAIQGSDLQQFHTVTVDKGKPTQHRITFPMPYSQAERQNGNVGAKQPDKLKSDLRGSLPPGWCLKVVMHNPQLYGYLHALQSNTTGRYFGIAHNMPSNYLEGFPAFIPVIEKNKRTNIESVVWRKVRTFDHPWDTEVMALVAAMRAGCFPLKELESKTKNLHDSESCLHSKISKENVLVNG